MNTLAGDATSGDTLVQANMLNVIQSTIGTSGTSPNLFVANIQGDYVGDIIINPTSLISGVGGSASQDNLDVTVAQDFTLNNNVDLVAQSGDATVSRNTEAGDATSGDATALANIINVINSSIAAGQSFIGILNIEGNYEGDVLVAQDVIDELIAANVPTTELCMCGDNQFTADIDNNLTINSDITADATSGSANVLKNTSAGDATSGNADTSVTVFNLTGQNFIADNAMLVFVNRCTARFNRGGPG
jgi:hypothetical protein